MPNGNQDAAQDIFNAMMAAARGEDKVAGDLLRGAFGKISGQVLPGVMTGVGREPGKAFRGAPPVERGEQESEVPEEE